MNEWYKFKILYALNNQEKAAFEALVFDEHTYRIIVDDQHLFKDTFLDIISGRIKLYKFNREKFNDTIENNKNASGMDFYNAINDSTEINTGNAIDNIKKYIELTFNGRTPLMLLEKVAFYPYIIFKYSGPDFNFNEGMNLTSANKALKNTTDIYHAVNDEFDTGEQITLQKAGSTCYELHTTKENSQPIKLLDTVITSCNNGNLVLESFATGNQDVIKNIVRYLYEASRIKNLDELSVSLSGGSMIKINFDNVRRLYNNIRDDFKTIKGVPDKISNKNNSFSIGKYSCYIDGDSEGAKDKMLLVKRASESKTKVKVSGSIRIDRNCTIDVESMSC